jgi:transposase
MEDSITLRRSEQRRVHVLMQLAGGVVSTGQAAELLSLSERQVRRLAAALGSQGPAGVIHGNRGRRPSNAVDETTATRVVELATTTYRGFNQHHLTEMLAEHEGIDLSRSSVRRILSAAGVPAVRRRRPPRHRSRRDRYPREGLLLQVDASRHDWLEERGPRLSLVGAIDDATGLVPWACFREQEDAHGYFLLMRHVVRRHGIPVAVYSDQHSIFRTTKTAMPIEEQLEGDECRPTQFGRLLRELGVTLILARSPQSRSITASTARSTFTSAADALPALHSRASLVMPAPATTVAVRTTSSHPPYLNRRSPHRRGNHHIRGVDGAVRISEPLAGQTPWTPTAHRSCSQVAARRPVVPDSAPAGV